MGAPDEPRTSAKPCCSDRNTTENHRLRHGRKGEKAFNNLDFPSSRGRSDTIAGGVRKGALTCYDRLNVTFFHNFSLLSGRHRNVAFFSRVRQETTGPLSTPGKAFGQPTEFEPIALIAASEMPSVITGLL
jgi:hypothetical protein